MNQHQAIYDEDGSHHRKLMAEEAHRRRVLCQLSSADVKSMFAAMDWAARSAIALGTRDETYARRIREFGDIAFVLREIAEERGIQ